MTLKFGEVTACHMSIYRSFVEVAVAALGSKEDNSGIEDLRGSSPEVLAAKIAEMTGR